MKTIVITGVSRGIGRAVAEIFLANGDFVIGSSRTGKVDFEDNNLGAFPLELGNDDSRAAFMNSIQRLNKPIDIFINCAGIWDKADVGPVVDIEALRRTFEVNLIGPIDIAEKLVPLMADGSHIVNLSSRRGSLTYTTDQSEHVDDVVALYPAYSIAKAGLNMFTRKLAIRLKGKTTVSCVHPGSVKTDMNPDGRISSEQAAEDIFKLAMSTPETGQFWWKGEKFSW